MPHLVVAPDKFKGSLSAAEVATAASKGASSAGWAPRVVPLSDGGEGFLACFGGANRRSRVSGPLRDPVDASWRLDLRSPCGPWAVIETAEAAGLVLAGGRDRNDPVGASTAGVGELIALALDSGARRIVVGCGGSATTDGGLGAVDALAAAGIARLPVGASLEVGCDVAARFVEAASHFAPQKGAGPSEVELLEARLCYLGETYLERFGLDVRGLAGAGAAGGLAGGLAAFGGRLVGGFELVAGRVGLDAALDAALGSAGAVVTGEGTLDGASFSGKVAGGVARRASRRGLPALCVAGRVSAIGRRAAAAATSMEVVSLSERFGEKESLSDTSRLVTRVVQEWLSQL